jgi:L-rhamnose-H+ transport protein
MNGQPALGVLYHWLGGLASGSFYVPYRGVKRWSWETYWLVGGVFSWLIAPWFFALLLTRNVPEVLSATPGKNLFWCFTFGLLWGIGGLTFGLTMRFLGLSLGMAIVMGLCAAFGTLMPPIFHGVFVSQVLGTSSGRAILAGIVICLIGIGIAGLAGVAKERSMPVDLQQSSIKEFNLTKGFVVASISGIMSACFAYGLDSGEPIRKLTIQQGTDPLWQGLPALIVVLAGGFLTNFIWTVYLHIRNRSAGEYLAPQSGGAAVPRLRNYLLCAVAGITWYLQFFFYTMGDTKMGPLTFSSWSIHMASIVIFSTLWGIGLKEWKGASRQSIRLLTLGLAVLLFSTLVVGYGNYLATVSP